MKYLNTSHLELVGSYGSGITSADGYIQTSTAVYNNDRNVFSIPVSLSGTVCFSVNCPFRGEYGNNYVIMGIVFIGTTTFIGFMFSSSTTRIDKGASSSSRTTLWTGSTPLDSDGNRLIHVRMNTTSHTLDMYINGTLVVENLDYGITATTVSEIKMGKLLNGYPSNASVRFNNFIVSDSAFPPAERVIEVTPTITTTDWTVTDGVATTDTVGDEMTLTVPSGSIDETNVKPTGYTVGLLNSAPSANVNAVDITQGSTTDQVILPSGATQSDYFTVSQASDISATVVARSVTV